MSNNSSTGGYLAPALPAPLYDNEFEDFLHDVIVGVSGFANEDVRPRWQIEPANQPDFPDNWIAFGIMRMAGDTYGVIQHDPADGGGEGGDSQIRYETVDVLLSAYGRGAAGALALIRDGFQIEQNRAAMNLANVSYQYAGDIIPAPSLVKERWLRRYDMTINLRRAIQRTYPVLTLTASKVHLVVENPGGTRIVDEEIDITETAP